MHVFVTLGNMTVRLTARATTKAWAVRASPVMLGLAGMAIVRNVAVVSISVP